MNRNMPLQGNAFLHFVLLSIFLISATLHFYQLHVVKEITLNNNGEIITMESAATDVAELLQEYDITLASYDAVIPSPDKPLEEGMVVKIDRGAAIRLSSPREQKIHFTFADTVSAVLAEKGLSPENCLLVSPSLNAPVYSGMEIKIVPYQIVTKKVHEKIPHAVENKEDDTIDQGRRLVLQEGREGIKELAYQVYFMEGAEIYREPAVETVLVEPLDAVVALGTKVRTPVTIASRERTETAYAEAGIASWYGLKFHGNRTTSGEVYDKNKFTAAHLTLPFNTLVRVTFLQTGKDVVVRINDRGPHIRGRIIDLSKAAAAEIGLLPHGVGKVHIEVVGKER